MWRARLCTVTWMGLYGHDLHKCTHLRSNLRHGVMDCNEYKTGWKPVSKYIQLPWLCWANKLEHVKDPRLQVSSIPPLRSISSMRKVMTKDSRMMVTRRFQRRQRARAVKKAPLCSHLSGIFFSMNAKLTNIGYSFRLLLHTFTCFKPQGATIWSWTGPHNPYKMGCLQTTTTKSSKIIFS